VQKHAELIYAETLLIKAVLGIVAGGDWVGLVKEASVSPRLIKASQLILVPLVSTCGQPMAFTEVCKYIWRLMLMTSSSTSISSPASS
jgi:hypothetical protein